MLGFIVAVIAGFLTPHAETPVAAPLARWIERWIPMRPGEVRLLAFALMLLAAGLVSVLLDSGSAFWIVLGGTLGYFGTRIVTAFREQVQHRRQG